MSKKGIWATWQKRINVQGIKSFSDHILTISDHLILPDLILFGIKSMNVDKYVVCRC